MSALLKNFVTVRKTRRDILSPAEYRSIVEMIRGIVKHYASSGFNDAYKDFLDHLVDYSDPHTSIDASFISEIIDRTYGIYTRMTASPLSHGDFLEQVVPTLGFLELIRRIVLNRIVYNQIKNPDGSVPETALVRLGPAWGKNFSSTTPVEISFGRALTNEDAFLYKGWSINTTPIPVVFNADDLVPSHTHHRTTIFHTATDVPYLSPTRTSSGYSVSLGLPANDFLVEVVIQGVPTAPRRLVAFTNGSDVLEIEHAPGGSISVLFNSQTVAAQVACLDGTLSLEVTSTGHLTLGVYNRSIVTTYNYTRDFSQVHPFVSLSVNQPIVGVFNTGFGLKSLTVLKG